MAKSRHFLMTALAVLMALLAVSCSPAPSQEKIDRVPLRGNPADITVRGVYDTWLEVEFRPVMNASAYQVKAVHGEDIMTQPVSVRDDFRNGLFRVKIYGVEPQTEYTVSVIAIDGEETYEYAYPVKITTKKAMSVTDKTKPVAWLEGVSDVSGGTFTAKIRIDQRASEKYRITVIPDPDSSLPSDSPYTPELDMTGTGEKEYSIPGITEKSLIMVEHGTEDGGTLRWSPLKTVISFPSSIDMYSETFKLTEKNGLFSWEGAGKDSVALYSYTEGRTRFETVLNGASGKGDSEEWMNPHSLESALYFLTDGTHVSNPVFLTTGPVIKVEKDQQNITLRWKEPAGFPITYSGISQPADENGEKVLRMTGLESLTDYTFTIKANFLDGRTATETLTVTTDSFEGRYRWQDKEGAEKSAVDFIVNVVKAAPESDCKYYVYTDLEDSKCREDGAEVNHRLSPLLDPATDETVPTDFTPFSDTTFPSARAYHWNESKWNSSSMHPDKWKVDSVKIEGDRTTSLVKTKAVFFELTTQTVIDFRLDPEGRPVLAFGNKGIGSKDFFVNGNLKINHSIRPELGEDEYTYVLEYIGEAAEIKEDR